VDMGFLLVLLVIWLAVVVLGVLIKGLFWLAVFGVLLLIGTAAYAAFTRGR
jgi:hypothetical protein